MKTYIDDSGSFTWERPGKSFFCAISLPDQILPTLFKDFFEWKRKVVGLKRQREIKGADLDTKKLVSFVEQIVLAHSEFRLTYVAADTTLTSSAMVTQSRNQWADVLSAAAAKASREGHAKLGQLYLEMSGWVRNRSTQNFLWLVALLETLFQVLQNTVFTFADQTYDSEFESWDIVIDKSFINRERHLDFWREWLRNQLVQLVLKRKFAVPGKWRDRNHPWLRNRIPNTTIIDTSELLYERTYFADSSRYEGLQLADICAHICFRYFKQGRQSFEPLTYLQDRIEARDGQQITLVHIAREHIPTDSAESHVHKFILDDFIKRFATE